MRSILLARGGNSDSGSDGSNGSGGGNRTREDGRG